MRTRGRIVAFGVLFAIFCAAPAWGQAASVVPPASMGGAKAGAVKVLSTGRAPRRKLRLRVPKGQAETLVMKMAVEMGVGGAGKRQVAPAVALTMSTKVSAVAANGDHRYGFTLLKTKVGGKKRGAKAARAFEKSLAKLYGLSGRAVVSNRGLVRDAKVQLPPKADALTKQVMQGIESAVQQLAVPFPDVAVGPGARWSRTRQVEQGGVRVQEVATYELEKIAGDKLTLRTRVEQRAPRQRLNAGGKVQVEVLKFVASGKGRTLARLSRITPAKATTKLSSTMTIGAKGGKPTTIVTTMKLDLRGKRR